MTDVELAVESYLSISLATYLSDIVCMVDVVSTVELNGIYIDTTSGAMLILHKKNDIETIS